MTEAWYLVEELAERWKVSTETIRRKIRRGELRAFSLGSRRGGYRISRGEVERFERERLGLTLADAER